MRAIYAPQSGSDPYNVYGPVQSANYPGQGPVRPMQSMYPSSYSAPAGIDIGSVITMMLPLVVMGMMSKVMVSGNAKDGEGKGKTKEKVKDKEKDKQDKLP